MLNFGKYFFGIYLDAYVIFILHFVNVMYHMDGFVDIETSLYLWNKFHLIMV